MFLKASACARVHTHRHTDYCLHSPFLSLTSPKPREKCAMLYVFFRVMCTEREKLAWHTKGSERCYLVSKLSLCLTYISAPKPPCLSITEKKSLLPRERVFETPIISSTLILHQVKGIEGDRKSYRKRMVGDEKKKKVTMKQH